MADLPYSLKDLRVVKMNIVSISGCTDPNVSYEDGAAGYLTSSFIKILSNWKPLINLFVRVASELVEISNYTQLPTLSFTNKVVSSRIFSGTPLKRFKPIEGLE